MQDRSLRKKNPFLPMIQYILATQTGAEQCRCQLDFFGEQLIFTGKTIYPFCTNEGSKMGRSEEDIKRLAAGAEIKEGLPIHGSSVKEEREQIIRWADQ